MMMMRGSRPKLMMMTAENSKLPKLGEDCNTTNVKEDFKMPKVGENFRVAQNGGRLHDT